MFKELFRIMMEVLINGLVNIWNFILNNLRNFALILEATLPYLMWGLTVYLIDERGTFEIGGEIFLPLFIEIIIYLLKGTANKLGKGITVPKPRERFTKVTDDGEITVAYERTEELLIYVADLEDWLDKYM